MVIVILLTSISSVGNVYEIQKAELYYRELEAKVEFNNGKRINHNPIHLASFLTCLFGEFVFDENIQSFLDELIKRQYDGKSLDQLVSDSLTKEQYEMWQQFNETKLNLIKYGSPFEINYEPYITSYIGYRINPTSSITQLQLHKGLDIGMPGGTPILAISDGVITRANFSSSYGNIVEIRHDDGYLSKYAHQQKLNVVSGQKVKKGDIIGFVGTTGDSTGNHLHLELYDENGEFMNPIFFIERGINTDKYSFRVWLLSLGLIGDEFKTARKHLLSNLDGNSAWLTEEQAVAQREILRQERVEREESTQEITELENQENRRLTM